MIEATVIPQFGMLEIDKDKVEIKITLDKSNINSQMVNHPIIGHVPMYKAQIADLCARAYMELTKRLEN